MTIESTRATEAQPELLPCPFCGLGAAKAGAHTADCYFSLCAAIKADPEGDLTRVPDILDAWNRRAQPAPATGGEPVPARDVCAEMRALCPACGGTGDVVSLDGEWRGACDCAASAWSREPTPVAPKLDVEAERLLRAVKVYAFNYMQDEAEDEEDCVCGPKQHAEAKEVFAAIRAVEQARATRSAEQGSAPAPAKDSEAVALLKRIARNPENVAVDSLLRDDLRKFLAPSNNSPAGAKEQDK